jgi:deoxyribodipyrimidine photolyase
MADDFLFDTGGRIELPTTLRQRVLCRAAPKNLESFQPPSVHADEKQKFILYLPTVVLRRRHNPGFAVACRIANYLQVPLVVLCTVLDDKHLSQSPDKPISMTARRLAFTLEALQSCTKQWEEHGAGVVIRIHGPGARTPHHLTLAHQALAVVTDEAFVEPYRLYMQRIIATCQSANVPCWSVDGSTTVPPNLKLRVARREANGKLWFSGVPAKAWLWEKQTNDVRKEYVYGATQQGHLTAPELNQKLPKNFFNTKPSEGYHQRLLDSVMPLKSWHSKEKRAKTLGLFAVEELASISNIKDWVMTSWSGADVSVPPCRQTHGSARAARQRWNQFLQNGGLKDYAKRRNQIALPHAVSRISCYLNLGVLSIFDVVHDVWHAQSTQTGYRTGCAKFLEEVVKWREIGYCYTFANPGDHATLVHAIPKWSITFLEKQQASGAGASHPYTYEQLERGATADPTWNAMQSYLSGTGELHNNARMTWGKTVVHWQANHYSPYQVLLQLCWLNDRFALDGLSPPSYAGILWCFGWGDKPAPVNGTPTVSVKPAYRYRTGPDGFARAKERLHDTAPPHDPSSYSSNKRIRREDPSYPTVAETSNKTASILSFFSPVAK